MLVGGLFTLAGISLGAALLDLADDPNVKNALLYGTWVRELVDERWWIFGLSALLAYAVRLGLAFHNRQALRILVWRVPMELVLVGVFAVVVALFLFWLNLQADCLRPPGFERDIELLAC